MLSCDTGQGRKVFGGELSVYYDLPSDEKLAEQIARYWKENNFLSSKKQDVKIIHSKEGFQLLLIENESFKNEEFSFSERKLLNDLKNDLQKNVFKKDLEIVICNADFQPKYKIN